jgi:imidazole glycerol-phosphate synthase subunit HisH
MVAIINYNVGNLLSIQNMFKKIGVESCITNNTDDIKAASKILLPGVGHFDYCMQQFEQSNLQGIIEEQVFKNNKPLLGICVGHQMLFKHSEEGDRKGLGWLEGNVVKFDNTKLPADYKIPNMGWADIAIRNKATLFNQIVEPRFYSVHSYYVECSSNIVSGVSTYGYEFVVSVEKDNIFGSQFHPEKSHKYGMHFLKNFANI